MSADTRPIVLVVDDKVNMLRLMAKVLAGDARVRTAENGQDAIRVLETDPVDVIVCDLRMPDMDGLQVLSASKRLRPRSEFILMTAYASVPTAVEALRLGAHDYLTKPFDPAVAREVVLRALGRSAPLVASRETEPTDEVLPGVLAVSAVMRALASLVRRIAASDATVVLLGETGTGKERLARAIHRLGSRANQRFVAVNCAAIPAELLESEVFGYARSAFTGATKEHAGLFEDAHRGSLFLDEIGEMGSALQAKLTRALEERSIRRLGESTERPVDVRLIVATHRDLEAMVKSGTFREDLWYRLNVAVVRIPPLRERPEDIELLASHFLHERAPPGRTTKIETFAESALEALKRHDWPGNVRQLRAAVERACVVATGDRVALEDLPPDVAAAAAAALAPPNLASLTWAQALEKGREETAKRYLEEVLRKHDGRVADAAAHAGVERGSFHRLMRRYGVDSEAFRFKRGHGPGGRT